MLNSRLEELVDLNPENYELWLHKLICDVLPVGVNLRWRNIQQIHSLICIFRLSISILLLVLLWIHVCRKLPWVYLLAHWDSLYIHFLISSHEQRTAMAKYCRRGIQPCESSNILGHNLSMLNWQHYLY